MFADARRNVSLKRAHVALRGGNLEEAGRILNADSVRNLRQGQELSYSLAEALMRRAREHAACRNFPEALLDLKRAIDLGGAQPEAIRLRNEVLLQMDSPGRAAQGGGPRSAKYVLWVDGVGTYLVVPHQRVTLGRSDAGDEPDVPLPGPIADSAAEIVRTAGTYRLIAHEPAQVNGAVVRGDRRLVSGDGIRLGNAPEVRFYLPCPVSTTAVLRLDPPSMLPGQTRSVILLDECLVLAHTVHAHIQTNAGPSQFAIVLEDRGFFTTRQVPGTVDASAARARNGGAARVALGARTVVGGLSFTLTEG